MAKKATPKSANTISPDGKERASFYVQADTMMDIKLIAVFESKTITDLAETALQDFVKKWVAEHGPLPKKPAS